MALSSVASSGSQQLSTARLGTGHKEISRSSRPAAAAAGLGRRQPSATPCLTSSFKGYALRINSGEAASRGLAAVAERRSRGLATGRIEAAAADISGPVAVVGGSGFVGSALVTALLKEGIEVKVLTRSASAAKSALNIASKNVSYVEPSDWSAAVAGCYGVVNLAGAPISTRWSSAVKDEIRRSRLDSTSQIVAAINSSSSEAKPSVLVNASAVGFYGISLSDSFTEDSPAGDDFLAQLCVDWEAAASKVEGSRLAIIRFGIVLDKDGGALGKMLPIFQLFAGGPLGSGQQWMSWIHRDDLVALIIAALKDPSYKGIVNGTAPNPVRVSELCDQIGAALKRPSWLPVPEVAVKVLLGEGASVVLDGQRVLPKRTQELGFEFKYRYVRDALQAILS